MNKALEDSFLFYAKNNLNVLLQGLHGVGKTSIIKSTFNKMGWNYIILNAATLDPYLDLIGAPEKKSISIDNNEVTYLSTALPEHFAFDRLDAIFIDELNRGKKETLNAMLDLILEKSIRGRKLNRLKVVWAAINPYNNDMDEDEQTYHVERLDPALQDRFHIFIDLPYVLNKSYLKNKYPRISKPFIEWWESLDDDLKYICSPRRLEYGMMFYEISGGVDKNIFSEKLPIKNLIKRIDETLKDGFRNELIKNINNSSIQEASKYINLENITNFADLVVDNKIDKKYIQSINEDYLNYYLISFSSKNKSFLKIIYDIYCDKKINLSDGAIQSLLSHINSIDNYVKKYINKLDFNISEDNLFKNYKVISDIIVNCYYDYYNDHGEKVGLLSIFNSILKQDKFKFILNYSLDTHRLIYKKAQDLNSLNIKKNKAIDDFTKITKYENELQSLLKMYFNRYDYNYFDLIIFGLIYFNLIKYNLTQRKDLNKNNVNDFITFPFSNDTSVKYFKHNCNLMLASINNYDELLPKIDDYVFNIVTQTKNINELEKNLNMNTDFFSNLLEFIK